MKNADNNSAGRPSANPEAAPRSGEDQHRLNSSALFGARNEIVIVHNTDEYRLRITRAGKLILTK
ncbi:hemin uptake protein HemP [Methylomicrobium sp. Wu6]|uniref:hemin uptake protein HemP n=1 Tax=Methylomicrobium sp. Wu6 TaxID=3107928 RepID=UPI002DD6244F|nr:hemin uptake protein HemP [Methylomicrobium sp. Wu6]MEC4747195.1 hemin uptake protein HemP [Methylomicrobium sp. Wu6]